MNGTLLFVLVYVSNNNNRQHLNIYFRRGCNTWLTFFYDKHKTDTQYGGDSRLASAARR
jgi:hypothetical protein